MYAPIYRCTLVRESSVRYPRIGGTTDAIRIVSTMLADSPQEQCVCVMLDSKNVVIGAVVVSVGTLDAALVHPREFFRPAVIHNAASVIFAHNHPSGNTTPSNQDIDVFKRLQKSGKVIGIDCVDAIIVGDDSTSLREEGY